MKIKTQVPCDPCDGFGYIPFTDDGGRNCEDLCLACEGKGYEEVWSEQLPAQVANQQERIEQLATIIDLLYVVGGTANVHIERLEKIILSMARGTESSIDDDTDDGAHTHWVYPLAETKVLLEKIKNSLTPSPDPSCAQSIEDMEYDAEMALHDGQLCD